MSLKNRIIGLATVGAAALALAPTAQAACTDPVSQVFAPWGDSAYYALAGGGSFEAGATGWTLSGAAKVVRDLDDGITYDGVKDEYALELGKNASATSPPICVATDSAAYRFFANAVVSKTKTANLRVEVLSQHGTVLTSSEVLSPVGKSVPSPKFDLVPAVVDTYLSAYLADWSTTLRIRVTSLNGSTVRVDDVHMDPRMR